MVYRSASDDLLDSHNFLDLQEEEDVLAICLIINKKFEKTKIFIIFARLFDQGALILIVSS